MDTTTGNDVANVVEANPPTWELISADAILTNSAIDYDAGLPEFPRADNRRFNKDLAEKVFCFASRPSERIRVEEKTVKVADRAANGKPIERMVTIPEHDALRVYVAIYNSAIATFDPPTLAELSGGWLVPQLEAFTELQLRTRAWTLRHNHQLDGSPWMLARPDRQMLGKTLGSSHVAPKTGSNPANGPMSYQDFEAGFLSLDYDRKAVLTLIGKDDFHGVDYAQTLALLKRQRSMSTMQEEIASGKRTPKTHAG